MTESNELFHNYLSRHFSHVNAGERSRQFKKLTFLHNYKQFLPSQPDAALLEIGPGYAELLELLAHELHYTDVSAIDVSQEVVDYCNMVLPNRTQLVNDSAAYLKNAPQSYDCIIMFHVLEHISKPMLIPLLSSIRQALKPQGKLIIEVPNMANPFTGLQIRYADFTHEVGFTETSMQYVLESAGFQHVDMVEARLPDNHYTRPFQAVAQTCIKFGVGGIYRAYASRRPRVLTPALGAIASN